MMNRPRRSASVMLYLWTLTVAMGALQPCCDVFADPIVGGESGHHEHQGQNNAGAAADTAAPDHSHASILDCEPATHIGHADGPPPADNDSSLPPFGVLPTSAINVESGTHAFIFTALWRDPPQYLVTGRLRL